MLAQQTEFLLEIYRLVHHVAPPAEEIRIGMALGALQCVAYTCMTSARIAA
jgi:hypothetical protein